MDRHASMNRLYRLVWSQVQQAWVVAGEGTRARGKGRARARLLALLALLGAGAAALAAPPGVTELPTGAAIVAGQVGISQNGATMQVNQASQRGILEWQSFNIGANAKLVFNQPAADAVTLNRVLGSQPSQIFGQLQANGQIYLVNPNGVYFSATASVDVGGLVATTHDIGNDDFMQGRMRLVRNGATGSVVNEGSLRASLNGYIALLAPEVRNQGVIVAQAGTVALAAGETFTLQMDGSRLASVAVDPGQFKALVENRLAVSAPGGYVILSAQAANAVMGGVVNNSGAIEANGMVADGGRILLQASDLVSNSGSLNANAVADGSGRGGSINVLASLDNAGSQARIGGQISARAGNQGGDGGQVETSARHVAVANDLRVDTRAPQGKAGQWLIDPADFTVAASGGDISGATLSANLESTGVSISSAQGTVNPSGNGDLFVNDAVSWSSGNTLTLSAQRNVVVNAAISGSSGLSLLAAGSTPPVVNLRADDGGACVAGASNCGTVMFGANGSVQAGTINIYTNAANANAAADANGNGPSYAASGAYYADKVSGTLNTWLLVNDVNQLQAISTNPFNNYALGRDINASATASWNGGAGFAPIAQLSGNLDGLNHSISGLTMQRGDQNSVALVRLLAAGTVSNLRLENASITGASEVAAIAARMTDNGVRNSAISNVDVVGGSVTGSGDVVGGIAASLEYGNSISRVSNSASISSSAGRVGGIAGQNWGTISNASNSGSVSGAFNLGGIVGDNAGTVNGSSNAGAVGTVGVGTSVGGIAGYNSGSIGESSNAGAISADQQVGGIAGYNAGAINTVDNQGEVRGDMAAGGVVGVNNWYSSLSTASNSGYVHSGPIDYNNYKYGVGGVVGQAFNSVITNVRNSGRIDGGDYVGGLVGYSYSNTLSQSFNASAITGNNYVGGLIGMSQSDTLTRSFNKGNVAAQYYGGGLFGIAYNSNASDVFNRGNVSAIYGAGGFLGYGFSNTIARAYSAGSVSGSATGALYGLCDSCTDSQVYFDNQVGPANAIDWGASNAVGLASADLASLNFGNENWGNSATANRGLPYLLGVGGQKTLLVQTAATQTSSVYGDSIASNIFSWSLSDGTSAVDGAQLAQLGLSIGGNAAYIAPTNTSNAGMYQVKYGSGLTLSGSSAWDYDLGAGSGVSYTITPRTLTLSAADNKVYDGTQSATVSASHLMNLVNGDTLNLAASASFRDKNVGAGKTVDVSGIALTDGSGLASNYQIASVATLSADISPRTLTVNSVSAANKTYDGNVQAQASVSVAGIVIGDDVSSAVTASFADKNAGVGKAVTANISLSGTDAGNYSIVSNQETTASITPKALTVTGMTAADKVYDGSTTAALSGGTLAGLVGGETLNFSGQSGSFSDKNVGNNKAVTVTGIALEDGSGLASNYTVSNPSGISASITPKALTVTGMTASDKVYDGSTTAALSGGTLAGLVGSETLNFSGQSGSFSDKNVGNNKAVTVTGIALEDGSGLASNYTVSNPSGISASITPKALTVNGMTASDKVYDGSTTAALSGGTLAGLVGGETLNFSGQSGSFSDKNAGSNKAVTVTGIALEDGSGLASNYTVSNPSGISASITPKALTVNGMTASDKVYDGSTTAALSGGTLAGLVGGETLNFSGQSGSFSDKNAGSNKAVTVTGIALEDGSGLASNYTVSNPSGISASITPKALTVTGMTASDKVYDGSTTAALSGGTLAGLVGGETLNFSGQSGSFSDKNVGSNKAVSVTGIALEDGSGLASNYTVSNPSGISASITPKALTVTGMTAADKVYDGSTTAALSGGTLAGLVGGETLNFSGQSGSFSDKNVGNNKAVTVTGIALEDGSGLASNYTVSNPSGISASITPRTVNLTGMSAADKIYDGTVTASLSGGVLSGMVAGETLGFSGQSGSFADKNVGSNKPVTVTGATLVDGSGLASNYVLGAQPAGLVASIQPAANEVTAPIQALLSSSTVVNAVNNVTPANSPTATGGTSGLGMPSSDPAPSSSPSSAPGSSSQPSEASSNAGSPSSASTSSTSTSSSSTSSSSTSSNSSSSSASSSGSQKQTAGDKPAGQGKAEQGSNAKGKDASGDQGKQAKGEKGGNAKQAKGESNAKQAKGEKGGNAKQAKGESQGKQARADKAGEGKNANQGAGKPGARTATAQGGKTPGPALARGQTPVAPGGTAQVPGNLAAVTANAANLANAARAGFQPNGPGANLPPRTNAAPLGDKSQQLTAVKGKSPYSCLNADLTACAGDPAKPYSAMPPADPMRSAQAAAHDAMTQSFDQVPSRSNSGVGHAAKPKAMQDFTQQLEDVNVLNTFLMFF